VFQTRQRHKNGENVLTYPHTSYSHMHTVHTDVYTLYTSKYTHRPPTDMCTTSKHIHRPTPTYVIQKSRQLPPIEFSMTSINLSRQTLRQYLQTDEDLPLRNSSPTTTHNRLQIYHTLHNMCKFNSAVKKYPKINKTYACAHELQHTQNSRTQCQ
jgi:hypothetical protein